MNVRDTMPMADLKGMMVGKDALGPDAAKRRRVATGRGADSDS